MNQSHEKKLFSPFFSVPWSTKRFIIIQFRIIFIVDYWVKKADGVKYHVINFSFFSYDEEVEKRSIWKYLLHQLLITFNHACVCVYVEVCGTKDLLKYLRFKATNKKSWKFFCYLEWHRRRNAVKKAQIVFQ